MEIKQGHMYQIIEGEVVEVVRFGQEIVPKTAECLGQLVLELNNRETL